MGSDAQATPRAELLSLLAHFEGAFRAHLDLLHKYMAFYVTVMVTILAATVAAINQKDRTPNTVALGPVAVCGLAILGWRIALVFYRRHIEAWMNVVNIIELLDLRISRYRSDKPDASPQHLRFQIGSSDTLIVEWERSRVRPKLKRGESVDDVMKELSRYSDVMLAVQITFALLGLIGVAMACYILFYR